MLTWFSRRTASHRKAANLYGAVVAKARTPELFAGAGIADTPEGRYEALVLTLFLVMERLRVEAPSGSAADAARDLIETFVTDMDDNMREMGVGDLTVPKKVKKAAAAFYDRSEAYRAAMDPAAEPGALPALVARVVPASADRPLDAPAIARHMRAEAVFLASLPIDRVLAGDLEPAA